jgi:aconitate hydratase
MKGLSDFEKKINLQTGEFTFYDLQQLIKSGNKIDELPFTIRILLENILRNYNGTTFTRTHLENILNWKPDPSADEIPYLPSRVLMQDFTGVPSIVDMASIRSEAYRQGRDPDLINPQVPVDLIIDHSVQVDFYGTNYSYERNVELEYERNSERYSLLKWAQKSFKNFTVLPPGLGICHQVNLEYLASVVTFKNGMAFPDTLVGTDSHTPMVNGIGVVGWGVGGIEAEAVMLGQPIYIMLPEVIGLKLTGNLPEGTTSTDLVLAVAELLRKRGVVDKFVEVFGDGLNNLTVPDRATISNMSPEFGCTVTYFPPDHKTLEYLRNTGRTPEHIASVEQYLKRNLLWRENEEKIQFTEVLELDLNRIESSVAGPKRPQDKIVLSQVKNKFIEILRSNYEREYINVDDRQEGRWLSEGGHIDEFVPEKDTAHKESALPVDVEVETLRVRENGLKSVNIKVDQSEYLLSDGSVVIAAITSCTNTSNPSVMLGAGLVAKKAVERGLKTKPWVKTSMAPGSKVVTTYLEKANLMSPLEALGFHIVGYGCTTCIGNSGPLPEHINKAIADYDLITGSVLSGNRNFEARIHPMVKMNFLTSPLLVIVYAIAGRVDINFMEEPLGYDPNMEPVFLKEIWPSAEELNAVMNKVVEAKDYISIYNNIFEGDEKWIQLQSTESKVFDWDEASLYIREAPFFQDIKPQPKPPERIQSARVLLKLGDSITTDHISPAGSIAENSPAGMFLKSFGLEKKDFNSYGSRRGNHEVMIRGTFANVRLKNELVSKEGSWTLHYPDVQMMSVFEASEKYISDNVPLIIIAGKEYGSGSSRDWAAKGAALLGVKAIIAESFERIHRSNLVGMGVLPLQFMNGENRFTLDLKGDELYDIPDLMDLAPNKIMNIIVTRQDGQKFNFNATARLNSLVELDYYRNGGILQFVLRDFLLRTKS